MRQYSHAVCDKKQTFFLDFVSASNNYGYVTIQLHAELIKYELRLKRPIVARYGTVRRRTTKILKLQHGKCEGYGEANSIYRPHSESFSAIIDDIEGFFGSSSIPSAPSSSQFIDFATNFPNSYFFNSKTALAITYLSFLDLGLKMGRQSFINRALHINCRNFTTLVKASSPVSLTKLYSECPFIKVKVHKKTDMHKLEALLKAVQSVTKKKLYLTFDANRTLSLGGAYQMLEMFKDKYRIVAFEDPFDNLRNNIRFFNDTGIPTIMHDTLYGEEDFEHKSCFFQGFNLNMSHFGHSKTLRCIFDETVKQEKFVVFGCDYNSVLSLIPLLPLMDELVKANYPTWYVEFDAPFLIENDPFSGPVVSTESIVAPRLPGLGVSTNAKALQDYGVTLKRWSL